MEKKTQNQTRNFLLEISRREMKTRFHGLVVDVILTVASISVAVAVVDSTCIIDGLEIKSEMEIFVTNYHRCNQKSKQNLRETIFV